VSEEGQRRLQKSDRGLIVKALEAQGFRVTTPEDTEVLGWCPVTNRFTCAFYWKSATSMTPGHWQFSVALTDAYSLKDLKTCITEASRVRKLAQQIRSAWASFTSSKSTKRWVEYRGLVAALFLRQDPEEKS
jgi:hypothetical protein